MSHILWAISHMLCLASESRIVYKSVQKLHNIQHYVNLRDMSSDYLCILFRYLHSLQSIICLYLCFTQTAKTRRVPCSRIITGLRCWGPPQHIIELHLSTSCVSVVVTPWARAKPSVSTFQCGVQRAAAQVSKCSQCSTETTKDSRLRLETGEETANQVLFRICSCTPRIKNKWSLDGK